MQQLHKKPRTHFYMRGFEYLIYSAFSSCLLVVMLLLPLAPVFAFEDALVVSVAESSTPTEETPVQEFVSEEVLEEASEPLLMSATESEVVVQTDSVVNTDTATAVTPILEDVLVDENIALELDGVIDDGAVGPTLNSESEIPLTTTDTVDTSVAEVDTSQTIAVEVPVLETPQEEPLEEVSAEEILSDEPEGESAQDAEGVSEVTDELGETATANSVTTDENRFTFAKGECTSMGDEMFYCAKAVREAVVTHTDRVFAAPDAEGDKEIYIEKDGEVAAISENAVDDDAPYFDASSNTIVWHRLIDGRYQIISYDIDREEETQITHDRYNNMAPTRYDALTVWQGWVGNDWEIFLLEGNNLTMVTDNTTHDITPSINGTHIIWQSFETGAWQMKVYDMRTKSINTIEDTEGGSIQNPRFVLVYDTKFESGDVETRGYDLVSGEIVPLSAIPAPVPNEIPDPDQTGEKSALVNTQTQLRTKVEDTDESGSGGAGAGGAGDEAPDLPGGDIVIPALAATTSEVSVDEIDVPLDILDVVIPLAVTESTSTTAHIDDVIITPYTEPIEPIAM